MQPLHLADDGRYLAARVGSERLSEAYSVRDLLGVGARLAFGSDWPVVSCDPLAGMRAAITHLTSDGVVFRPDQRLEVEEAWRAYTVDAASALGIGDVGVIREGAWGDLVVLDRDPVVADWTTAPPRVRMTIVGGRVVHETAASSAVEVNG